jgi:hypothetical protein
VESPEKGVRNVCIIVVPEAIPISSTAQYFVVVDIGGGGGRGFRSFFARFVGASQSYHFTSGIVVPHGAILLGRNTTFSAHPINMLQLLGYFVRGPGLDVAAPFPFPNQYKTSCGVEFV